MDDLLCECRGCLVPSDFLRVADGPSVVLIISADCPRRATQEDGLCDVCRAHPGHNWHAEPADGVGYVPASASGDPVGPEPGPGGVDRGR